MSINLTVWIWPFVIAGIVFTGFYLHTKDLKNGFLYGVKTFMLAMACFSIIEFEIYLDKIFVGHYNEMGLPSHFSHSGWRLLFDAWPIWIVPLFIIALLQTLTIWIYFILKGNTKHQVSKKTHSLNTSVPANKTEVLNTQTQLAIHEMKQKFETALRKYEEIKQDRYQYQTRIKQLELALVKAKKNPQANAEQVKELQRVIDEQNEEITEANELIEHLLQQLYEEESSDSGSNDFF